MLYTVQNWYIAEMIWYDRVTDMIELNKKENSSFVYPLSAEVEKMIAISSKVRTLYFQW